MRKLVSWIRVLIFATVLTPLIVTTFTPFPFVFGKIVFIRIVAAVVLMVAGIFAFFKFRQVEWRILIGRFRNPILIAVLLFILSAAISSVFAPSPYRSFFGEAGLGDGIYTLLAFFIIFLAAFFIFEKRHWRMYFRFGLLVSALVILHVFIRSAGLDLFSVGTTRQPGSFLGNPAYVASFVILLFAYAAFVHEGEKGFWKYFALAVGLGGLGVLAVLAVRGAILGVAVGILAFLVWTAFDERKSKRRIALVLLAVLILGSAVPVLNRVKNFSFESASVQSRLISWGISWEAFKERPILGWGPENYDVAYNKHYNPAYAAYSEEFFDRAHNKILDVLVMQGVVGLLAYLAVFFGLFFALFKTEGLKETRLLISSVVVAYFVQNLFIFDHLSSYLLFFAVLFFVAHAYSEEKVETFSEAGSNNPLLIRGAAVVVFLVAGYSLVAWNLIPLVQAKNLTTEPYNFFQKEVRVWRLGVGRPITAEALDGLEEVASREPYDLRFKVRLAELYNRVGTVNGEFLIKSGEFIREAEALSPRRQAIRGVKALLLGLAGNHEEAIEIARETVAFEPRAPKSHYYLGMVLAISSQDREGAVRELNIALDHARELAAQGDFALFFESDFQNIFTALRNLEAYEEMLEAYKVAEKFFPFNLDFHREGLVAARGTRDADEMVRIARRIRELDAYLRDEMDVIIDLAQKENWEILDDL